MWVWCVNKQVVSTTTGWYLTALFSIRSQVCVCFKMSCSRLRSILFPVFGECVTKRAGLWNQLFYWQTNSKCNKTRFVPCLPSLLQTPQTLFVHLLFHLMLMALKSETWVLIRWKMIACCVLLRVQGSGILPTWRSGFGKKCSCWGYRNCKGAW